MVMNEPRDETSWPGQDADVLVPVTGPVTGSLDDDDRTNDCIASGAAVNSLYPSSPFNPKP